MQDEITISRNNTGVKALADDALCIHKQLVPELKCYSWKTPEYSLVGQDVRVIYRTHSKVFAIFYKKCWLSKPKVLLRVVVKSGYVADGPRSALDVFYIERGIDLMKEKVSQLKEQNHRRHLELSCFEDELDDNIAVIQIAREL